jgi:hypothetical protein
MRFMHDYIVKQYLDPGEQPQNEGIRDSVPFTYTIYLP